MPDRGVRFFRNERMSTVTAMKDTTGNVVNGVNVDDVQQLIAAIEEDEDLATSHFRLTNKWINGGHNRSRIDDFYSGGQDHMHLKAFELDADEPAVLAGTDKAANPVEYLLHALCACLETTLVYHAAVRGIQINALETTIEGDLDLRGFLGISNDVRRVFDDPQRLGLARLRVEAVRMRHRHDAIGRAMNDQYGPWRDLLDVARRAVAIRNRPCDRPL